MKLNKSLKIFRTKNHQVMTKLPQNLMLKKLPPKGLVYMTTLVVYIAHPYQNSNNSKSWFF